MVSFSCENCGDVLTKKKLDSHRNQCRGASFTCLDCMVHFRGVEYRSHTSCISEAQKYQGSVYKEKKGKNHANGKPSEQEQSTSQALVPRSTMVEDQHVPDAANAIAVVDAPPHAPSPPPLVNVFDYLIGDGGNGQDDDQWESDRGEDDNDMRPERLRPEISGYNAHHAYNMHGFSYGVAPVPPSMQRYESYVTTPDPRRSHSRNVSSDQDGKKSDKKRKRAHVDDLDLSRSMPASNGDVDMTDVPPLLHSGLTGGINRMMSRPDFPPSPDLSNGDAPEVSPQSPLKKSKRDKSSREREHRREKKARRRKSDSDKEERRKDRKKHDHRRSRDESGSSSKRSGDGQRNGHWERRKSRKRSESPSTEQPSPHGSQARQLKAIEYPQSSVSDGRSKALIPLRRNGDGSAQTPADMFMTCLVKGSDSERGVSVWKALKRWRRDVGSSEKDMFKRLRVRMNERGECVLFVLNTES